LRPLPCPGALPGVRAQPPGAAWRLGRLVRARAPRRPAGGSGMIGPDQRVELAREYLTDVSRTGVEQLPPTVLAREVADLRRLLGQVLAILGERQAGARQVAGTDGPFGTEREARAASLWEQLARPVQGAEPMREANLAQLMDVCAEAGVQLGA